MYEYPEPIENLIENLRKLPSVGRKSAQRMALHIVNMPKESISEMISSLENVKEQIHKCSICGNLTENSICNICLDKTRDNQVICIVEDVTNLLTIENSNSFNGKYHVLNGLIDPSSFSPTDDIGVDSLLDRIDKENIREIIFAISPTLEGETTMLFIKELLNGRNIKMTRIASGIPVGGNLEYFDEITLRKALEDRRDII